MNTLDTGWRMPAEWTPHAATWMAFPHNRMLWESEWGVSLADVQQDFAAVANAIARFEPVKLVVDPAALDRAGELCAGNVELIELAIDDSWCRDSGPSFVCHPQLGLAGVSWRFNAWGGKSAYAQDASLARRILDGLGLECFGVPLANEGGAIHVDGEGTLITTESVLLNANRNPGLSKAEIEALFARLLGVTRTIWLPGDPDRVTGDMTDGHVDGVCAFARPGALLLDATRDTTSAYAEVVRENRRALELALDARGRRFELIELFDAGEVAPEEGCSVPPTPISISPMARSSCRPTVSPPTTRPPRPWPGPSPLARWCRCASTTWPTAAAACIASPSSSRPGRRGGERCAT